MNQDDPDRLAAPVGGAPVGLPVDYIRQGMTDELDDALSLEDILTKRSPAGPAPAPASSPTVTSTAADPDLPAPAKPPRARARSRPARAPIIKPSVVHVPAPLLSLMAAERQRSGRSNGEILIAAIEDGHDHLKAQRKESTSIGGRLFTARDAKPQSPAGQPLSPLNIRLYEQDYEVLDRLVAELGAGSRSRLATLALARYLDHSA